jgi:hypothetical protein
MGILRILQSRGAGTLTFAAAVAFVLAVSFGMI